MTDVPVSLFLAVSIIIVFLLYWMSVLKTIPCNNDMTSVFKNQFIHVEPSHILSNLFALYAITRVERKMQSKKFIMLVVFIATMSTLLEVILHRIFPDIPCSIGFSGILFGLMTWELVTERTIDVYLLSAIAIMIAAPSFANKNVSLSGHFIGAFTGGMAGLMYRAI